MTLRVGLTEIIASGLEAAASEMCASLIRTAYSPNIKERGDCSAAICDLAGRTIALATNAPAHLGSTLILVPAILERFPLETLRSGDVFFANGTGIPDYSSDPNRITASSGDGTGGVACISACADDRRITNPPGALVRRAAG